MRERGWSERERVECRRERMEGGRERESVQCGKAKVVNEYTDSIRHDEEVDKGTRGKTWET